jgi:hypothetical protein
VRRTPSYRWLRGLSTDFAAFYLISACDEALKALKQVVGAVTELKIFDMGKFEDHAAKRALDEAKEQIKACFTTFGVRTLYQGPISSLLTLTDGCAAWCQLGREGATLI